MTGIGNQHQATRWIGLRDVGVLALSWRSIATPIANRIAAMTSSALTIPRSCLRGIGALKHQLDDRLRLRCPAHAKLEHLTSGVDADIQERAAPCFGGRDVVQPSIHLRRCRESEEHAVGCGLPGDGLPGQLAQLVLAILLLAGRERASEHSSWLRGHSRGAHVGSVHLQVVLKSRRNRGARNHPDPDDDR
ncbi:MAG: hypothetical protein ACR2HD_00120 [Solirubrobacteraceae bacterium]